MSELNSSPSRDAAAANTLGEQAIQHAERLQVELDAIRDQLAQSNRLGQLGMLTAAIAHETNNLLTPIGSYAQLALANPGNAELAERALRAAVVGTQKAAKVVEGVMELAKPSESPAIEAKSCDIKEVADAATSCMLPVAKQLGINLTSDVESALVAIDALAMEQVLINLISNACQAMAQMPSNRRIAIESSELNGRLIVQVTDNGPGVPESIRDQLFEPFITQTNNSEASERASAATKLPTGSGLGLSICKQIVEAAGGQITLANTSDGGSTFEIHLPISTQI